jgi:hypothetical protein
MRKKVVNYTVEALFTAKIKSKNLGKTRVCGIDAKCSLKLQEKKQSRNYKYQQWGSNLYERT